MTCWFCNVAEEHPDRAYRRSLFGEIDAKATNSVTNVRYIVHHIDVPRCALCRSKHRTASFVLFISLLLLSVALVLAIYALLDGTTGFSHGLLTGLAAGTGIAGFVVYLALHKGIATTARARNTYPEIAALREKGYRFGKAPKDSNIEVYREDDPGSDADSPQV
jgi:hypothetical protein